MNKFARLLIAIVAAAPFAVAAASAGFAAAKSVRCDENNVCKTYCTQNLGDGAWVEYEEGTVITIYAPEGEYKFKCKNGKWVRERLMDDPRTGPNVLGVIAVGSVAGVRGDYEVCHANRVLGCEKGVSPIGPPGLLKAKAAAR